jgi:hypothetical protein
MLFPQLKIEVNASRQIIVAASAKLYDFRKGMEPMLALGRRAKLAAMLVRALYDAKNQEDYSLRKAALEQTMEADLLAALAVKVSGRPS